MQVSFSLTAKDYVAFMENCWSNSPTLRRQRLRGTITCVLAAAVLLLLLLMGNDKPPLETAGDIWPLLLGALLAIPVFRYVSRRSVRRYAQQLVNSEEGRGIIGDYTLEIEDDGLVGTAPSGDGRIDWKAIQQIRTTNQYLFVILGNATGLIIPRDAFSTPGDCDRFESALRQRQASSLS